MKIFGLIVAILIWLLTAFGCAPEKTGNTVAPETTVEPTALPTVTILAPTPTPAPAARTGKSSSSHRSGSSSGDDDDDYSYQPSRTSSPTAAPATQHPSSGEDTLMPEIGGGDSGDSDSSGDSSGSGSSGNEDTLLPEL